MDTPKRNITQSRIRGLLNEAKTNALFELLSDQAIEETILLWLAAERGKERDEKKTLAAMMPAEVKDALRDRFGIDIDTDAARITIGEELFSRLMKYINYHPERLTTGIYDALVEHKMFHWVVSLVQKKQDVNGNVMLVPTKTAITQQSAINAERIINLENVIMAKIEMIIDAISKKKVTEANLGSISKALRDIVAAHHMLRLDFAPDQAMEATFRETTMSDDGKTTRESVTRYVKRSAETWSK